MNLTSLNAISPIDGRYRNKTENLSEYFSEFALFKYRYFVEIEYFIALCHILPRLKDVEPAKCDELRKSFIQFQEKDALRMKEIEKVTNHDVKATEYFLREKFAELGLGNDKEFIHFGLTSQDINNTAQPIMLKKALDEEIIPVLNKITDLIKDKAEEWKAIPMLAYTHGQPASPTRLGKEIKVFAERLIYQTEQLKQIEISGKFGGATGNFNAHCVAYPNIDWVNFANRFLQENLNIKRQQTTTQIEHYDNLAEVCDCFQRINNILIDFSRDIWLYISMQYFQQKINKNEVGSSAMPHKVNPIDFENAEGNLGIANAIFQHLSGKLPVSRLQRDLTDSTVMRNLGVPFSHSLIALKSLEKGINKLIVNKSKIAEDLENNWAVVAEAIQTILRRENFENPYDALKKLTRTNQRINREVLHQFIDSLKIKEDVKKELKQITPENYTGV